MPRTYRPVRGVPFGFWGNEWGFAMLKHRFVAVDFLNSRIWHIDETGRHADWAVPSGGKLQDMQLAGNGQLLVSRDNGWAFHDLRDGRVVRQLAIPDLSGLATLRLLPGGFLMGGLNTPQGVEVWRFHSSGQVLQKTALHDLKDLRLLRQTTQGTWLLAHHTGGCEIAISETGHTVLKTFSLPGGRYAYQLLCKADGHYLLSGGYSLSTGEFSTDCVLLREFTAPQPAGMQSFFYSGFQVLPDGNLVQANWSGHDDRDYTHGRKLFEFNRAGDVVWSWIAPKEQVGSILNFLILDGLDFQLPHDDTTGTQQPFSK